MRLRIMVTVALCVAASPATADKVLYCIDNDIAGFKWDNKGQASTANFVLSRFTVKIGPDSQARFPLLSDNERLITQTSDGQDQGLPMAYKCAKQFEEVLCNRGVDTTPWLFAVNGHYVRAFLAGGPPASHLDPNIAIAYGSCTNF